MLGDLSLLLKDLKNVKLVYYRTFSWKIAIR